MKLFFLIQSLVFLFGSITGSKTKPDNQLPSFTCNNPKTNSNNKQKIDSYSTFKSPGFYSLIIPDVIIRNQNPIIGKNRSCCEKNDTIGCGNNTIPKTIESRSDSHFYFYPLHNYW